MGIDISNPTRTQAILRQYGLTAKKKFGQNFLTSQAILDDIVAAADVQPDDVVIEIGPGLGALTEQLAKRAKKVLAFEIDPQMVMVLNETLAPYSNVTVIEQDILTVDLPAVIAEQFGPAARVKFVANLPYYITTPILMALLQAPITWDTIVVMMQKEVADRLNAPVGTKAYGVLTLMMTHFAEAATVVTVPPSAFQPAPKVSSAVVKLQPDPAEAAGLTVDQLFPVIKTCFAHRRKNLMNNLQHAYARTTADKAALLAVLERLAIAPTVRAERLTHNDFVRLTAALLAADLC